MAFVAEGQRDRSLARSAWDSAAPKSRPLGYGLILAGVRINWMIGVANFERIELNIVVLYYLRPTIRLLSVANTFSCLKLCDD
jgi:hypothetical protein